MWPPQSGPIQLAKQPLASDPKDGYGRDIAQLNTLWETDHASWQALWNATRLEGMESERMRQDLAPFSGRVTERYFEGCRRAIKEVAPSKLYLGCRFARELRVEVADACARYLDVTIYNVYKTSARRHRPS